jgi:hypothetical protein
MNKDPVVLTGKGAILSAAAILEQRRHGRELGGKVIIKGARAIESLIYGDYDTLVNYRWMNAHHSGEFEVDSRD